MLLVSPQYVEHTPDYKEIIMTDTAVNHITSIVAAIVCASITIGMSVAPAISPTAALFA